MANSEHLSIITASVFHWNEWRRNNPQCLPDLEGADLEKKDLRRINLSGASLRNAQLTRSDLTEADLSNSDLTRASLWFACFRNANLSGATLTNAVIADYAARGANFTGANLRGIIYEKHEPFDQNRGFLELACAEGLEDAEFDGLLDYIGEAFKVAHDPRIWQTFTRAGFLEAIRKKIKALRTLYADQDELPPPFGTDRSTNHR